MNTFLPIPVGQLRYEPKIDAPVKLGAKSIEIRYPSRLEAMALDPSKVAYSDISEYGAGQVNFCIDICKKVRVEYLENEKDVLEISSDSPRHILIKHAATIMCKALSVRDGLRIVVDNELELRHCGLGSSSSLMASVAAAINELYGKPISAEELTYFLARNHGEEIDGNDEEVNPVQCIGGSAACGLHEGGVIVLAGKSRVIASANLPEDYAVVIGIPNGFTFPDSQYLLKEEEKNMHKFIECGKNYGPIIAYRLLHSGLPALTESNIGPIGDLIFEYRFKMGSIENCSFVYPPIVDIAKKIGVLKQEGDAIILSLSSVGPGFFAITQSPDRCIKLFEELDLKTYRTSIHNGRYTVLTKNI